MRRRPHVLQAFLAFVVFWSAAHVLPGGTTSDGERLLRAAARETVMVPSPAATIASRAPTLARDLVPHLPGGDFLPSRGTVAFARGADAPPAFARASRRDDAPRARTYDATAPPAVSPDTVR